MLENNVDLDFISKVTKKSIKEIEMIVNEYNMTKENV